MIHVAAKYTKLLALATLFLFITTVAAHARMVSVAVSKLNLRSGPGTRYAVQWEYGKGVPLKVLQSKGSWSKVQDFENDVGWVYKKMVKRSPHMIVKGKRVNIRSGPGTNFKLIGKADYGVVFTTLKQESGWAKVKHENGLVGWIKRNLIWGW
jgi:SH3-like domain-containing protein